MTIVSGKIRRIWGGHSRFWKNVLLSALLLAALTRLTAISALALEDQPPADGKPDVLDKSVTAALAAGLLHSAMIDYDGRLLMWGDNTYGQIGSDSTDYEDTPAAVSLPRPAVSVSLGINHTLVALDDGTVRAFGRNAFGQLGNGTTDNSSEPVTVTGLPFIRQVAAGAYHSLALGADGSVWAWGNNSDGQVGDSLSEAIMNAGGQVLGYRRTKPAMIVAAGATAIAAGNSHSLYLNSKGEVYAWGGNNAGQLGDGTIQPHPKPVKVAGLSSVTAIAAGYQHNLALCRLDGRDALMAWGDDSLGQLGLGSNPADKVIRSLPERVDVTGDELPDNDTILSIAAGFAQSAAIVPLTAKDGAIDRNRQKLLVWGANSSGQLGLGRTDSLNRPMPVSGTFDGWTGDHFLPFDGVALGGYHTLLLSSKGILAAAGRNDYGQLGNQSILDRHRFVPVETPDLIRPAWIDGSKISLEFDDDMNLVVRWPAAQDNRMVAGYKVKARSSDGRSVEYDAGGTLVLTIKEISPFLAWEFIVLAYDQGSAQALDQTLSRLAGCILPDSAPDGAIPEDYFQDLAESVYRMDYIPNHWQLDPQGLIRPLEMPWDTDSIYGRTAIAPPPDWRPFTAAASAAGLLLAVSVTAIMLRARKRAKLVRPIRLRVVLPSKS